MLWGKLSKIRLISLKSCFSRISIDPIWFSINRNLVLNSVSLCLVWLIEPVFRSIEHRVSGFLKTVLWLIQTPFQKFFFKLFFSLQLGKAAQRFFCHFLPQFLQGFPPSRPIWPFYLSFCSYFHVFMHLKGIFRPF